MACAVRSPLCRLVVGLLAGLGIASSSAEAEGEGHADGSARSHAPAQPEIDPLSITGTNFAGVRIPLGPVEGAASFAAQRAWVWAEPAASSDAAPVRRMLLSGDVRVELGMRELHAARAAVWLQRIDTTDSGEVYQIFVHFDRVRTPTLAPSIGVSADRLSVEAVVAIDGAPALRADVVRDGPVRSAFLSESEGALADRLRSLLGLPTLEQSMRVPGRQPELRPGVSQPYEPGAEPTLPPDAADLLAALEDAPHRAPIFAESGVLSFGFGRDASIAVVPGRDEQEDAVVITGGITVLYQDLEGDRSLEMKAERGVVFVPAGTASGVTSGMTPEEVRGLYLEGGVLATDGQYTLRGPRVFYDLQRDRAIVADAVFSRYDRRTDLPLYARAETMRQESADQFSADRVRLANTSFFTPHFSIGAERVTLTQRREPGGQTEQVATARHVTLRAGKVPFLYWPIFHGDPQRPALRSVAVDSSTGDGFALKTSWNVEALLGVDLPDGLGADLLVDGFFNRGAAVGTELDWDREDLTGRAFTYWIFNDQGEDRLRTGREIERDGETRGMVLFEQRHQLDELWTLWLDAAFVHDETFVDAFFDEIQRGERELTTGGLLQRRQGNTVLELDARTQVNDFIVNDFALQTPGFVTERLPEARYIRQADDLLASVAPGVLTLFSEYRAGLIRANSSEPTARELGFDRASISQRAFGIDPDESIAEQLALDGVPTDAFLRADTRQELSAQLEAGPFRLTPFTTGRVTFYDDQFDGFGEEENDSVRLWGGAGVTLTTTIQGIFNGVESRALDLHRLRHLIEPSVTVFHAATNVERGEVPVFDNEVDRLVEGTMYRFALDQTWQTQRGGPGRRRSVDVVSLDAEVVLSSETGEDASIGRFFPFRPELSRPGDFGQLRGVWQFSDAIAFSGESIFDFEVSQQARTSAGILVDHSPTSSTSVEYRFLNVVNESFLDAVNVQELGDKYELSSSLVFDLDRSDLRRISTQITREFPSAFLGFAIGFDNIQGTTSFGFTFQPKGFGGSARVRGVGSTNPSPSLGG